MLKIEIIGMDKLLSDIHKEVNGDKKKLKSVLIETALKTHSEAISSIKNGGRTGRTYQRRTVTHKASAAGEAPKTDTEQLVQNITFDKTDMTVGSRKGAPHGFWLEFGTSKMAARPWLQPAFDKAVAWFDSMKGKF